ncbi:MAG: hypothetical protein ACE5I1_21815 [bacterium]
MKHSLELACRFYGLQMRVFYLNENHDLSALEKSIRLKQPCALVVNTRALLSDEKQEKVQTVFELLNEGIPVLYTNVDSQTKPAFLSEQSGRSIRSCAVSKDVLESLFYEFGNLPDFTNQLSGLKVTVTSDDQPFYFEFEDNANAQVILEISDQSGEARYPVFVNTQRGLQKQFFLTDFSAFKLPQESGVKKEVFELLPLLMFLKYAGGEKGWHNPEHYANLTIDDPWLAEPYGNLSYMSLLKEMDKVNFHTTIAFIPWNFDRSEPEVVSLFKKHPDKFSISIHGNNHDHREFYRYESSKSLRLQEKNIQQALARMERFRALTGLPYDRVMVFPQGIAPEKTLALLRQYNFLATVNGMNVPFGSDEPASLLFGLRPVTMQFADFASLSRTYPHTPQFAIALELFLDNPLLFYTHQDFFANGIDTFNETAEFVNAVQPGVHWVSLGNLLRHLYLMRRMDDGNYEVLAFSNDFILENDQEKEVTFYVRKRASLRPPIKQVKINGQMFAFETSGGYLTCTVTVPAKEQSHIIIEYENDFDISSIDVSKKSSRVALLRKLSDFRDMTLSTNALGRAFTRFYYQYGLFKFGLAWLVVFLFMVFVVILFSVRKKAARSR